MTALPADPPRAWPGQDLSPPPGRLCAQRFLSSQFPAHPSQTEYCSLTEVCYEEDWDEPLPLQKHAGASRAAARLPPGAACTHAQQRSLRGRLGRWSF